ncbi:nucleoside hydrolase [Mycobacterium simiae]|uniref:Nucleoside hydrolase n=1 Tax=Mycobacterium simiae TaxID=1784 RepID=A0A5B1BQK4_MYCSI|nr:nucleoside hydrolase [Mycobacterium simiae]KAA1249720.1 nucleoside hydrolase [Mycobacterium simiae]
MNFVFVDVDTGVDDALALLYLLASPDADLVGIASTGGNVAVQQVCANNLGLLELCRVSEIPVSRGADATLTGPVRASSKSHGPRGLGYAELPATDRRLTGYDSATAWVRAAHAFAGELIGVVTGPLTNVARALRAEPALPRLLRRLVIMGGCYDGSAVAEWNISVDPEAAAEVLTAWFLDDLPILCGLDLTRNVTMTPGILAQLAVAAGAETAMLSAHDERGTRSAASNPVIRVIEDAMRFYLEAHYDAGHGYLAHLHDPLAAAIALDTDLVVTRPATVHVEVPRGTTLTDPPSAGGTSTLRSKERKPNAVIGIDVDREMFFDRFIQRVGILARRMGNSS